jgi:hypothetical protein
MNIGIYTFRCLRATGDKMKRVCRVEGHINWNVAWMLRDSSEIEMDQGTARLASDILEPQPCGLKAPS